MKQILLIGLMLLSSLNGIGQIYNIDSLITVADTQDLPTNQLLDIYRKVCVSSQHNDVKILSEYSEKGLLLAEKENEKRMIADFYRFRAKSYELYGNIDTAVVLFKKGVELAIEIKYGECEAMIYRDLGAIAMYNSYYKDNQLASEYFMKTLQIAESLGNKELIALALIRLGSYHLHLNNLDRSASYLEQADKIADEINSVYVKVYICYNLAEVYSAKKETDKAIYYASEGLKLSQDIGHKEGEIMNLQSLAYYYCLGKGENDKAEKYATECLRMAEEFGGSTSLIAACTVLSYVYLYQRRFDECKAIVLQAWEKDSLSVQLSTLTNLAAAYLYTGEFDKAHSFFVNYVHHMEQNAQVQFQKTIIDIETKYETEKKEIRILSLEREKGLYIWLGIAGVLLAGALGVVLWQNLKNARKEKQLIATRSVLDGEMSERSRLARDLHDRLSGNLAAVKMGLTNNNNESIHNVYDKLDSCIEEIRRVAHNLMPISLQFGMKVALEDYARQFPNVNFHFFGEDKRIEERREFVVYCCASELVNNSLRHSGATVINLQLIQDEKYVSLTVQDNGCGYDEKSVGNGMGLKSIRDRVSSCGGRIDILTSPGKGSETTIELKTANI